MNSVIPLPGSYIVCLKANSNLVLAYDPATGLVRLAWRNISDKTQLWNVTSYTDAPNCYRFYNQYACAGLCAPNYGDGLRLTGDGDLWNIAGNGSPMNFNAFRLNSNLDWNLNALGNGPYDAGNPVGVWEWASSPAGGADNELWMIGRVDNLPPRQPNYVFIGSSPCVLSISSNDMAGTGQLVCSPSNPTAKNPWQIFDKIQYDYGFAFQNKLNGKFICYNGPRQPLGQASVMSIRCFWMTKSLHNSTVWMAICAYLDANQNFNVLGDPDNQNGAVVGAWDWAGGQRNEAFSFADAS